MLFCFSFTAHCPPCHQLELEAIPLTPSSGGYGKCINLYLGHLSSNGKKMDNNKRPCVHLLPLKRDKQTFLFKTSGEIPRHAVFSLFHIILFASVQKDRSDLPTIRNRPAACRATVSLLNNRICLVFSREPKVPHYSSESKL